MSFYMNKLYFLDKTIYGVNFTIFVINYNRTIKDHACHVFQKYITFCHKHIFFSNLDCPECVHAMDLAIVNFFTCADPENPPGWGWDGVSEAYFW